MEEEGGGGGEDVPSSIMAAELPSPLSSSSMSAGQAAVRSRWKWVLYGWWRMQRGQVVCVAGS